MIISKMVIVVEAKIIQKVNIKWRNHNSGREMHVNYLLLPTIQIIEKSLFKMKENVHVCMCVHVWIYVNMYMYLYLCVCVCVCVCMCVCVYVCMNTRKFMLYCK